MRTSWKRQTPKGNTLTSWKEAYIHFDPEPNHSEPLYEVSCLYEDVSPGEGPTLEEAKDDFLENIRLKITELSELLEFCAKHKPRVAKGGV